MRSGHAVGILTFGLVLWSAPVRASTYRAIYERGTGSFVVIRAVDLVGEGDVEVLNPTGFCVDRTGSTWVVEAQVPSLKKFTEEGECVVAIESRGEGPGDLGMPTSVAVANDGSIVVYDIANRRFAFFSSTGEVLRVRPFSDIVWKFDTRQSGELYVETRETDFDGTQGGSCIRLWRYSFDLENGAVVDSLRVRDEVYIRKPRFTNVPVPFPDVMLWALSPAGNIVVAKSRDYSIRIVGRNLETLAKTRHAGSRVKVTDEDKKRHFEAMTTTTDGVVSRGAPAYIRDATEFPKYKPAFAALLLDPEGYILLKTYAETENGAVFDVFDPNTVFVGQVKLSGAVVPHVLANGRFYRLDVRDETVSIKQYRIE